MQVNFLGTGSAEPSKYRGASAIHIRFATPYIACLQRHHSDYFLVLEVVRAKGKADGRVPFPLGNPPPPGGGGGGSQVEWAPGNPPGAR